MLPPEAPLRVVAAYLCDGAHAFGAEARTGAQPADDALPGRVVFADFARFRGGASAPPLHPSHA